MVEQESLRKLNPTRNRNYDSICGDKVPLRGHRAKLMTSVIYPLDVCRHHPRVERS